MVEPIGGRGLGQALGRIRDFPDIAFLLVVDDEPTGVNPTVNNLANMSAKARHPFLLVSDSDIRVGPDYLQRVV